MKTLIINIALLISVFSLQAQKTLSFSHADWKDTEAWEKGLKIPAHVLDKEITIQGEIFRSGDLMVSSFLEETKLIIEDSLILHGDLYVLKKAQLEIKDGGVLIIFGNLYCSMESGGSNKGNIFVFDNAYFEVGSGIENLGGTLHVGGRSYEENDMSLGSNQSASKGSTSTSSSNKSIR